MTKKILIIEDEEAIQNILKNYLLEQGYEIEVASDGIEGFTKFQSTTFDLVLLDVMMPKIDGYAVLEMIREYSDIPIIMITAMDNHEDEMKAFDLNVDDYITKPFVMGLVIKRIEAVLRRSQVQSTNSKILSHKELVMNIDACEVTLLGKKLSLTHKEFELLRLFLENKNLVFSRETLLERLWGYDFYGNPKVVNVHIQNLRRKLNDGYIETVRGVGYKLAK